MTIFSMAYHERADNLLNSLGEVVLALLKMKHRPQLTDGPAEVEEAIDRVHSAIEFGLPKIYEAHNQVDSDLNANHATVLEAIKDLQLKIISLQQELARKNCEIHPINAPSTRDAVFDLTGGVCTYCNIPLAPLGTNPNSFCVEHVVPKSKGGPDNLSNYVPSCCACNSAKRDRHVIDFVRSVLPKRIISVEAAE
jgi:hypothetical protein